jgi:RAP domain
VSKIALNKYNRRIEKTKLNDTSNFSHGEDDNMEDGHVISKENVALREVLTDLKKEFHEEYMLEDSLFKVDFYIPSAKLVIEINGKNHFYPYSTRFNNFTNMKSKTIRANGHGLMHLNSWKLEGMLKDDSRAGLKDLLSKTIATYENIAKVIS